jgi:low affinity Fe/Cu permease
MEHSALQRRISRILQFIGEVTSRSGATAVVIVALLVFGVLLGIEGFPVSWQTGFATIVEGFTLLMLFVIQHTQGRHQKVLQLKLDELIRSSPHADDLLVKLEVAEDEELLKREQGEVAHHESLRDSDELKVVEFVRAKDAPSANSGPPGVR